MNEALFKENLTMCHLILRAIADEPETFFEIFLDGEDLEEVDYDFVTKYFEGLLDIAGTDMP